MLGEDSVVMATLHEMSELCQRMFFNSLSSLGNKLSEKVCIDLHWNVVSALPGESERIQRFCQWKCQSINQILS